MCDFVKDRSTRAPTSALWRRAATPEPSGESRAGSPSRVADAYATTRFGVEKSLTIGVVPPVPSELMPAAVYVGEGRIAVEEVPCPEPGPGEVLVEIAECGICGSDLHMVLERYAKPGAILGHEWSGIVASAPRGSGWSPGDRVVGNPTPGCGVCRPCRRGRPSVCLRRPRRPSSATEVRSADTRRSRPTA